MQIARALVNNEPRFLTLDSPERGRLWEGTPWNGGQETDVVASVERLLCPVIPSKIVCVGRNYRAHAAELGNEVPASPLLFLKPPSALLDPDQTIRWPLGSDRVDYEGEIGVVIGRRFSGGSAEEARRAILGITAANDVTARDLQRADVQFTRGKGFDTFCPCGPWIETEPGPLEAIELQTRVNAEVRQTGHSRDMIWSIVSLLTFIGSIMTLLPGDLVLTGTPEGVAPLGPGDVVEIRVGGLGALRSTMGPRP